MVQITNHELLDPAPGLAGDRLLRLQEQLYRQMLLLLPDDAGACHCYRSQINARPALHLQILERHKYTTFVRLTHVLRDGSARVTEPEAHIRCCHDLRVAEVTAFGVTQGINRIAGPDMHPARLHQIHWRQNRTLCKWLHHLLECGHSSATMTRAPKAPESTGRVGDARVRVK